MIQLYLNIYIYATYSLYSIYSILLQGNTCLKHILTAESFKVYIPTGVSIHFSKDPPERFLEARRSHGHQAHWTHQRCQPIRGCGHRSVWDRSC